MAIFGASAFDVEPLSVLRQTEECLARIRPNIRDNRAAMAKKYSARGNNVLDIDIANFVRVAETIQSLGVIRDRASPGRTGLGFPGPDDMSRGDGH